MPTLAHEVSIVNPIPRGWECIEPIDRDAADRLAWNNDSPDNDPLDGYPGPDWQEEVAEETSIEDEYFETGRSIGLTGDNPDILTVFAHHSAATRYEGERAFYLGLLAGRRSHARRIGRELGLSGKVHDRPASIHARFEREYQEGHKAGADEWAARQDVMAEWDAEAQADVQERWLEQHNAEANGVYRMMLVREVA